MLSQCWFPTLRAALARGLLYEHRQRGILAAYKQTRETPAPLSSLAHFLRLCCQSCCDEGDEDEYAVRWQRRSAERKDYLSRTGEA